MTKVQWQSWWEHNRHRSEEDFRDSLVTNQTRHAARQSLELQTLGDRLLSVQNQLYRTTVKEDRPELLVTMLHDPWEPMRRLAISLLFQRQVDNEKPDPQVLTALVESLNDSSAGVRARAALLLRNAGDAQGADVVSLRLATESETDPEVLQAYLQVMAGVPRAQATERETQLLSDPVLRPDDAAALAAALDAGLFTAEQTAALMTRPAPADRLGQAARPAGDRVAGPAGQRRRLGSHRALDG